ncbi:hypothetical protein [Parageobacillus thermoglucosidasius]|uniref:Phage protein n=1 Tax=Parageobacillus thermoglucosidasius TaxID=1426 RepID=A0AB38R5Y3_PARTM|nr:hypothetical protein [Parageobacillus thermoglucosidasius]UOE78402.1 hypothetical protein IMI45_20100 [Parageobacillus thermoglucosidasius]
MKTINWFFNQERVAKAIQSYVQAVVDFVKTENEIAIVDYDAVIEGVKDNIDFFDYAEKMLGENATLEEIDAMVEKLKDSVVNDILEKFNDRIDVELVREGENYFDGERYQVADRDLVTNARYTIRFTPNGHVKHEDRRLIIKLLNFLCDKRYLYKVKIDWETVWRTNDDLCVYAIKDTQGTETTLLDRETVFNYLQKEGIFITIRRAT